MREIGKKNNHSVSPCRICQKQDSMEILYSFGEQPVAGYLEKSISHAKNAPRFVNAIAICSACGLVQQAFDDAKQLLIGKVYPNYQPTYSMSEYVRTYLESFLDFAFEKSQIEKNEHVIEVGSNDGFVLRMLSVKGFNAIGFDPSADRKMHLLNSGMVVKDYFGLKSAQRFIETHEKVKLIITRHTLEHVWDPLDFLKGISTALVSNGIAVMEVPYLPLQIMNNQFQSMTFQHVSFFNLVSLQGILEKAGLKLLHVNFSEMDAGSIIMCVGKTAMITDQKVLVDKILDYERAFELNRGSGYDVYFSNLERQQFHIKKFLETQVRKGIQILAYGAGSKGQAILNMLHIESDLVGYVIDDTPGYAGQFIPGVGTEIISSNDQKARDAGLIFITAPTHVQEILRKEKDRAAKGIPFISSIPTFHFAVPKGN